MVDNTEWLDENVVKVAEDELIHEAEALDDEVENGVGEDIEIEQEPSSELGLDADEEDCQELRRLPREERLQAIDDMCDLYKSVEGFEENYKLVDKLGEGTFSAVYKAIDLKHHHYDNGYWFTKEQTDSRQLQHKSKVYVALKRIYQTSCPLRIQNELELLHSLRRSKYVSTMISAFRHKDQVVAVMPYHPNSDFREYYRHVDYMTVKNYFKSLFKALRDVHRMDILHRDIKPANFLFSLQDQKGVLCDFGLAQYTLDDGWHGHCHHTQPTREHPHGQNKLVNKDIRSEKDNRAVERTAGVVREADRRMNDPKIHVGYSTDEKRPMVRANRAGTRGFRAPEVLLKCQDQTTAIDMWSAGVILLSFLSRRFPFFNSNDDNEALVELTTIYGLKRMIKCGEIHNRSILSNIPHVQHGGKHLHLLLYQLNPFIFPRPPSAWHHGGVRKSVGDAETENTNIFTLCNQPFDKEIKENVYKSFNQQFAKPWPELELYHAIDLCKKLMHLDCTKRLNAQQALMHPFLYGANN